MPGEHGLPEPQEGEHIVHEGEVLEGAGHAENEGQGEPGW